MVHEVVPGEALYQPGVHTLHAVLLYIAGMALKRPASQWVHFNAAASDQVPAVHALHAVQRGGQLRSADLHTSAQPGVLSVHDMWS